MLRHTHITLHNFVHTSTSTARSGFFLVTNMLRSSRSMTTSLDDTLARTRTHARTRTRTHWSINNILSFMLTCLQTTSVSLGFCKLIFPANALVVVRWEGCWNGACVNNLYIIIVSYIGRDTWLHTGSSKLDHEQEQTMIDNDAKLQPLPESRRRQQLLRT